MDRKNVVPGSGNLIGDPPRFIVKIKKKQKWEEVLCDRHKIVDTTRLITAQARLGYDTRSTADRDSQCQK